MHLLNVFRFILVKTAANRLPHVSAETALQQILPITSEGESDSEVADPESKSGLDDVYSH